MTTNYRLPLPTTYQPYTDHILTDQLVHYFPTGLNRTVLTFLFSQRQGSWACREPCYECRSTENTRTLWQYLLRSRSSAESLLTISASITQHMTHWMGHQTGHRKPWGTTPKINGNIHTAWSNWNIPQLTTTCGMQHRWKLQDYERIAYARNFNFSHKWSIPNFPCGLTRNITSYSMKNSASHSSPRWKMIYATNSHYHLGVEGLTYQGPLSITVHDVVTVERGIPLSLLSWALNITVQYCTTVASDRWSQRLTLFSPSVSACPEGKNAWFPTDVLGEKNPWVDVNPRRSPHTCTVSEWPIQLGWHWPKWICW